MTKFERTVAIVGLVGALVAAALGAVQLWGYAQPKEPDAPSGWQQATKSDVKWLAGEWCESRYKNDGYREVFDVKGRAVARKVLPLSLGYEDKWVNFAVFKSGQHLALGSPNPLFIVRDDDSSFHQFRTGSSDASAARTEGPAYRYRCDRCKGNAPGYEMVCK